MIERSGERGSGISVLTARHDDDDDDDAVYVFLQLYRYSYSLEKISLYINRDIRFLDHDNLSKTVPTYPMRLLISLSVGVILLLRHMN